MIWESEVRLAAGEEGLDGDLILAIVKVESGGDTWAIRYEPGFKAQYLDGKVWKRFGPISAETEVMARATSWGLMQIMGQVARERGFTGTFLSALCQPEVGLEWGCKHLKLLWDRYHSTHGLAGVIAAYNAGSPRRGPDGDWVNTAYVKKVSQLLS